MPDQQPQIGSGAQLGESPGRLITCRPDELRPHPSYVRHQLTASASQLSALAERGDLVFREPLVITRDRIILDGYARWELARHQRRPTLPCLDYELSDAESLQLLIARHQRSNGLNAFSRILLALELEAWFGERAQSNQRAGGQLKGLSKLTEAERLDVREEIAATAGASAGNVHKVKRLKVAAHSDILAALRSGEISIHRAWIWSNGAPEDQREALREYRGERGIKKAIRTMISRHRPRNPAVAPDLDSFLRQLAALESKTSDSVSLAVIKTPGKAICVTEELLQVLQSQQMDLCATTSR